VAAGIGAAAGGGGGGGGGSGAVWNGIERWMRDPALCTPARMFEPLGLTPGIQPDRMTMYGSTWKCERTPPVEPNPAPPKLPCIAALAGADEGTCVAATAAPFGAGGGGGSGTAGSICGPIVGTSGGRYAGKARIRVVTSEKGQTLPL